LRWTGIDQLSRQRLLHLGPTWQDYAEQYRDAKPIVEARSLARSMFPVKRGDSFEKISEHLGPRFLNRDSPEDGDWILSVNETG